VNSSIKEIGFVFWSNRSTDTEYIDLTTTRMLQDIEHLKIHTGSLHTITKYL